MKLKNNTKKNVTLYIYNENKLLTDEVNYGKKKKKKPFTAMMAAGRVPLWCWKPTSLIGKKGEKAVTTKEGYTYDRYRNVLTDKSSKAYLAKK